MVQQQTLPSEGLVKLSLVLKVIPVSKSTWFRGIAAGRYPKPVKIGIRASAWRVEEIRRCMTEFAPNSPEPRVHPTSSPSKRRA